jgi:adenine-specific DNA methylase
VTTTQPTLSEDRPSSARRRSFIEVQVPVSRLSKESYRERKAVAGQTLTALGKWWGRKPLVLVRACILGLLLPATDDPEADRETFLALMTMDDDGLARRRNGSLGAKVAYGLATPGERERYFEHAAKRDGSIQPRWRSDVSREGRQRFETIAFKRMGYDAKLEHCLRPEEIDGPSLEAWQRINEHLGTNASTLSELVAELGQRRFGHVPRVGDAFCGGGSIPFEAARIGCEAFGSDLSPVAALLTWGALSVVGGGTAAVERVSEAQRRAFEGVRAQVEAWGIERNEQGWVADAFLYCAEVTDPATGWRVPMAPSWVIASKTNVIARLVPEPAAKGFELEIVEGASADEMRRAVADGTSIDGVRSPVDRDGRWLPPEQRQSTSLEQLRGREGLRLWEASDVVPRTTNVYQERLYCVRWLDPATGERHYRTPTTEDLSRERRVLELLHERFVDWQAKGYLPRRRIEPGQKTEELRRTRGWTYWHHLFNPRQLLLNGLFAEAAAEETDELAARALLLMVGRLADFNSRLCRWQVGQGGGIGGGKTTFYNQAYNTLNNYSCRPLRTLESAWSVDLAASPVAGEHETQLADARVVSWPADVWITDPGYADAINYEELSELFLAWYDQRLPELFPGWYSDSKRALAVAGKGLTFRQAMVECYRHLASLMPDDGLQIVMFTHQDAEVWADLALVLWAAGLQVTAAWTVATETESAGLRQGNYVQGTVLLVLRKRSGDRRGDLSDLYPEIQSEVQSQLGEMLALDPKDEPNFDDADYQLAAYAAALRVMTGYGSIAEVDVDRELSRERRRGEDPSPLATLIQRAVKIASDYLVPDGLDRSVWRRLTAEERLYVKGVEVESHGEYREGVYQEFARGFGVREYRPLLASDEANRTRLKTPSEFKGRDLRGSGFDGSLLRDVLFAVYVTARDGDPRAGRTYLRQELADYWDQRQTIIALARFLAGRPAASMEHWARDTAAAQLLAGAIDNDSL